MEGQGEDRRERRRIEGVGDSTRAQTSRRPPAFPLPPAHVTALSTARGTAKHVRTGYAHRLICYVCTGHCVCGYRTGRRGGVGSYREDLAHLDSALHQLVHL
eukprot:131985-Rhodomonas_salina.1